MVKFGSRVLLVFSPSSLITNHITISNSVPWAVLTDCKRTSERK